MRPKTLAEVAELTAQGDSFDRCLASFLDGFYSAPSAAALTDVPRLLQPNLAKRGQVQDVYLAATAEALASAYQFSVPAWTVGDARVLRRPWFASSLAALRAVLILESPAPFRARNLFVSANALSRV